LHPRLVQAFDLPAAPVLFELDSQALAQRGLPRHATLSRFPQVRRDLAFVLDVHTPADELLAALSEVHLPRCGRSTCSTIIAEKAWQKTKKALLSG
jgi:phenylalanyl-tRNA synthetase beta subunit